VFFLLSPIETLRHSLLIIKLFR